MIAIIPARLGSTRLPEKLLLDVHGKPLIKVTLDNVVDSAAFESVVVATADKRIADVVRGYRGVSVIMTDEYANGTSRVAEAVGQLRLAPLTNVVNIQADEPLLPHSVIKAFVARMNLTAYEVNTIVFKDEPTTSPDVVKAVVCGSRALYFSRSMVPANSNFQMTHVGIYGYSARALASYKPPSIITSENLEQLGWLERGVSVGVLEVDKFTHLPVDIECQYRMLLQKLKAS